MFSLVHAWNPQPQPSSSSLAHALGFAPLQDEYIDIQPPDGNGDGDALFRLLPALAMPMGVLIPSPADFSSLHQHQQTRAQRDVKPEPAEPTLHGLVYVFEHARRTEDGSVSFDLCDEASLPPMQETTAAAAANSGLTPKRGMKAMMGVFRVDPFTTGGGQPARVADVDEEEEDGGGEEEYADGGGANIEFQVEMDMTSQGVSVTPSGMGTGLGQLRDGHPHDTGTGTQQQHVPHDPRPALLPFISALSSPASPSSPPTRTRTLMDSLSHPSAHSHSRPSTAASSRSASSFAPANGNSNSNADGGAKKKPKKVKMHACDVCHKEFPRPSGLQTHMNVHSGAKPYKCPVAGCSKRFGVRSNATRHLRVHQRQQAHAASQQHQHGQRSSTLASSSSTAASASTSTIDSWLGLPDVLRPTPADVLAAQHPPPQQQRWIPDSLQHLTNALELPAALRGPRVEGGGGGGEGNEWPYHPSQWASKLPGPGPLRQWAAAPSHAWVGA